MEITKQKLYAGDSWSWTESLAEYPASQYTLKIYLQYRAEAVIELTGTASGDDHVFTYTAEAELSGGEYVYRAKVIDEDDNVTTIESGSVIIKADLAASTDSRNHYQKVIDAVEAIIEGRASKSYESISINGRAITEMSHSELLKLHSRYKYLLKQEAKKEKLAQGLNAGGKILIKFQ